MAKKDYIIYEEEIPIVVPKRILVFAGHPDDEIISCGGTILKYRDYGSEIIIAVATSGLGGYAKEELKETIEDQRKKELESIKKILNCKIIELGYNNLRVNRDEISEITNLIREIRPDVILMPHFSDYHRVHRNLSYITRESIYHCASGKAYGGYEKNWTPLGVYYYESPSCKFQYVEGSVFIVVDINKYWNQKKDIFKEVYISQNEVLKRVLDWAEDTAELRGLEINSTHGEAYIPETTYTPLKLLLV